MVFTTPSWAPKLLQPPDSIAVSEFILNERYGRRSISDSRDPYICGLSEKSFSTVQLHDRRDDLAKGIREELGWQVNHGSEFDKVGAIFCLNTIDLMTVSWAIHRLNGISSPASAAYSASELAFQLKNARATCLFTCRSLLPTALRAAEIANIPRNRIYLLPVANLSQEAIDCPIGMKSLDDLISRGKELPALENLIWSAGQGKRQTAFICYSSGTSGLPKGVQISHYNVISNVLQNTTYESAWREKHTGGATEVVMGCLPFSHIYGLVLICHTSTYRGDQVVVLPKFDLINFLTSIMRFRIYQLFVVPPIVVMMTKNWEMLRDYDLSSVKYLYTGAAPLGKELVSDLRSVYPSWNICQAYGLTESATVSTSTSRSDIWPGSAGSILPGAEVRIIADDGTDIDAYDTPGEIWFKGPSVVIGYLDNERATSDTFIEDESGRWLKTGDKGEIRICPESGNEHVWIVDRIKELIKGNQVAPAELESHILSHPSVADCAVIPIPDDAAGEVPKAYVVKSKNARNGDDDARIKQDIMEYVKEHKTKYKWVKEIDFIDVIPKSASGKILRRILRDLDKAQKKDQTIRTKL